MDVELTPEKSGEQLRDRLSSRLTIGQMLLPVFPFVLVFIAQSLVFLDASSRDEIVKTSSNSSTVTAMVDFQWRFGPYLVSSSTTTLKSLIEQLKPNSTEEFFEQLNASIDQARLRVVVCVFPFALIAWIVIGRVSQWHSRVTVRGTRFFPPVLTVVACMGILFALVVGFALLKSWWPPAVVELVRHFRVRAGAITVIHMVIVAPVAEELVFRSFLCRILVERIGPVAGIFLQALIFGSLHLISPAHAAVAFAGGIVLGVVYVYTRSLGASIFLHASSNALLLGACIAMG